MARRETGSDPSCVKRRYATRTDARNAARKATSMPARQKLRAYFCSPCGFWHVGHLAATVRRGTQSRRGRYGS